MHELESPSFPRMLPGIDLVAATSTVVRPKELMQYEFIKGQVSQVDS